MPIIDGPLFKSTSMTLWKNKGRPGAKARIGVRDLNCRMNSGFTGAG